MSKKITIILSLVFVIVAVILFFVFYKKKEEVRPQETSNQNLVIQDYVTKNDSSLTFKLDNGKTKVIKDKNVNSETYMVIYRFVDYLKDINAYLVSVQRYEGGDYLLIDKSNGNSADVSSVPVVSNDKNKFITHNLDLESGYTINGFQIYRIDKNNGYVKEYEETPNDWGPSSAKWINDNEIEIEQSKLNSNVHLVKYGTIRLVFDRGWKKI